MSGEERIEGFGPIYLPALQRIRTLWIKLEPLVKSASFDDIVSPTELHVTLTDGLGTAETARFDIRWSEREMYSFHYIDSNDINWRFDRHPNPHSPNAHFHPPPDASTDDAVSSCIGVTEVSLVTRAVHAMWREAYRHYLDRLNSFSNPP